MALLSPRHAVRRARRLAGALATLTLLAGLFAAPGTGTVLGGVVVAPSASELIFPVTLAVSHRLNVDQLASAFTVYPSLTGSIAEAARRLHAT